MTTKTKIMMAMTSGIVAGITTWIATRPEAPNPHAPPPVVMVHSKGDGFSMSWDETVRPYVITLDWIEDDTDRRTTIHSPFGGYVWTNLPPGEYTATVHDADGTEVHRETFNPRPGAECRAGRATVPGILEVSLDLVTWFPLPAGHGYQADPATFPRMFFRLRL